MHSTTRSQPATKPETDLTKWFDRMIYGGDYNPEQWPEEIWHEDARLMREAGINLVSLGVFAWARSEPRPGVYTFDWLDRVIDLLYTHGVRVNLATATASPPPWLAKLHPETLPVNADGVRLSPGSRRHYCPHSDAYHEHAIRFVQKLAERYCNHPALAMWHIDNEYGCHVSECFCDASAAAFRTWLQHRYSTLDALNDAWGTTFWGQIYGDWDEIVPPRRAPYTHNPCMLLDWRRFSSDSWLACFEAQRDLLQHITPDVPVTTNFMGFFQPIDYRALAAREDVVANDSYPDPADPTSSVESAMQCDLMRSLKDGRPWLLMEQATSHVNWRPRNAAKSPGQMRLGSYQAIGRGANGIMFFQWRASKAGGEQFHSAMLPHAGTAAPTWHEVAKLGSELRQLDDLLSSRVVAEVAILFDWHSWWALTTGNTLSSEVDLLRQLRAFYAPLFARNIAVDFVPPESDLSRYRLVLAPHLYLVSDEGARNIEQYVMDGGRLIMSFLSGMVDEQGQIRVGGYPAPFRELLGLRVVELMPYAAGQTNQIYTQDEETYQCHTWSDLIVLEGADVLASYTDDFYAHQPAITSHRYGQGYSYYLGTSVEENGMAWLLERICAECDLRSPVNAPAGVEVVSRVSGSRSWHFVLNHTPHPVDLVLPALGRNILDGGPPRGTLQLSSMGVAIVETTAEHPL